VTHSPTPLDQLKRVCVVLTAGCNLDCSYCYQDRRPPGRMDWATLEAAVDLALACDREEVELTFAGGEPLLAFDLLVRAVEHLEGAPGGGRHVHPVLLTNGLLLTEEVASFAASHDIQIQLSFDGLAQDLRQAGTFPLLDHLLDSLRVEHPSLFADKLSIAITVTPAALPSLAGSVRYFLDKRVQRIEMAPVVTHVPDYGDEHLGELERAFAEMVDMAIAHFQLTRENPVVMLRPGRPPSPTSRRPVCWVMQGQTVVVDVDGQVYGCAGFAESYQSLSSRLLQSELAPLRMGSIHERGLPERHAAFQERARRSQLLIDKQDKRSARDRCVECAHFASCSVCPLSTGHIPGNDDPDLVPSFQCDFTRLALEAGQAFARTHREATNGLGLEGLIGRLHRGRAALKRLEASLRRG